MKTLLDSRIARLLAASALAAAVGVMTLPSTAEAAWHGGGGYAGHGYGGGWHGGWGGGYHGGYGGYGYRGGYGWHGGWGWGPGVVGGALLGLALVPRSLARMHHRPTTHPATMRPAGLLRPARLSRILPGLLRPASPT